MNDINILIEKICLLLNISAPHISYDVGKLSDLRVRAAYETKPDTLYIGSKECDFDTIFAISHELRHKWQYVTNEEFYLYGYKTRKECADITEYNLQEAELDANAFATVVLKAKGVSPLFNGLPESVKKLIYERADKIIATL